MKYVVRRAGASDERELKGVLVRNGQKPTIVIDDRSVYYVAVGDGGEGRVSEDGVERMAFVGDVEARAGADGVAAFGPEGVVGMAGAEISGQSALIRSLAVLAPYRGNGIAGELIAELLNELRRRGIMRLYLFRRDAGAYWRRLGFDGCDVEEVAAQLSDTPQVAGYIRDGSIRTDVAWRRDLSPVIPLRG